MTMTMGDYDLIKAKRLKDNSKAYRVVEQLRDATLKEFNAQNAQMDSPADNPLYEESSLLMQLSDGSLASQAMS